MLKDNFIFLSFKVAACGVLTSGNGNRIIKIMSEAAEASKPEAEVYEYNYIIFNKET